MNFLTLIANIRHFKHEQEITKVNIIMYYLWTLESGHRVMKSDLQSSKSSRSCESFFGAAEAAACLDLADGFFTGTSSSELDSSKIQRRQNIHTVKIPANEISVFTLLFSVFQCLECPTYFSKNVFTLSSNILCFTYLTSWPWYKHWELEYAR